MNKTMKDFLIALIIIASVIGLVFILSIAIKDNDYYNCIAWEKNAKQYPGFYITEWQKAQCDYHGIQIDAPVR